MLSELFSSSHFCHQTFPQNNPAGIISPHRAYSPIMILLHYNSFSKFFQQVSYHLHNRLSYKTMIDDHSKHHRKNGIHAKASIVFSVKHRENPKGRPNPEEKIFNSNPNISMGNDSSKDTEQVIYKGNQRTA